MSETRINYIEFPARDLEKTRRFFEKGFGWSFTDYGPDYTAFSTAEIDGGFFHSQQSSSTDNGAALVIFYSQDLEASLEAVKGAGGEISKDIFAFPGGRRFHFKEPSGNELAVWSDKGD